LYLSLRFIAAFVSRFRLAPADRSTDPTPPQEKFVHVEKSRVVLHSKYSICIYGQSQRTADCRFEVFGKSGALLRDTPAGDPLTAVADWARKHRPAILEARKVFDAGGTARPSHRREPRRAPALLPTPRLSRSG
jgi:hypothetical protein